jgi:hypothetical protein
MDLVSFLDTHQEMSTGLVPQKRWQLSDLLSKLEAKAMKVNRKRLRQM